MRALTLIQPVMVGVFAIFALSCGNKNAAESADKAPAAQKTNANKTVEMTEFDALEAGKKVFKRCKACHTLADGAPHKVGPNLWGVMGRTAGTQDGFKYSKVMAESGIVWTEETLREYLRRPSKYMPGNKMSFAGLRKDEQLDAVIAYVTARTQ